MNLKEIQEQVNTLRVRCQDDTGYVAALANLIANLAARMQELVVNEQGVCSPLAHAREKCNCSEKLCTGNADCGCDLCMGTHQVTVSYRSSINVNIGIIDQIKAVAERGAGNVDYLRIISD